MGKKYTLVCDIDNCFTDSREWIALVREGMSRAEWDEYQEKVTMVKPNQPVIDLCVSTAEILPVTFITSREDRKDQRKHTIEQISEFSGGKIMIGAGSAHRLLMRKEYDYRPAPQVKEELLCRLVAEDYIPLCAIDDDEENCKMFAKYDLNTVLYKIENNEFVKYHKVGE